MDAARLDALKREIAEKRAALARAQDELRRLQKEIEGFARQYDQIVGPLAAQLDRLQERLEQLRPATLSDAGLWGPYASFEESFDAKYRRPLQDTRYSSSGVGVPRPTDPVTLRALYRGLVRRYHPDSTQDAARKIEFTIRMAQINAAYRAGDAKALYALDGQRPPEQMVGQPMPDLRHMNRLPGLSDLLDLSRKLDIEITDVQIVHRNLLQSPLMELKIEYSVSRARGANLLRDIAERMRREIRTVQAELDRRG